MQLKQQRGPLHPSDPPPPFPTTKPLPRRPFINQLVGESGNTRHLAHDLGWQARHSWWGSSLITCPELQWQQSNPWLTRQTHETLHCFMIKKKSLCAVNDSRHKIHCAQTFRQDFRFHPLTQWDKIPRQLQHGFWTLLISEVQKPMPSF